MKKYVLLGLLVAVVIAGGLAMRFGAPRATDNTKEEEPITITETTTPEAVVVVEQTTQPATLQNGTYVVATEKSTATWEGRKPLLADYKDTGTLGIKSGSFVIASGTMESGTLVFDMTTIKGLTTGKKTGESMLEKHLKSADFFNVEKFPTAEFKAKEAVAVAGKTNAYTVKGDLTIKGITNPVEIPVMLSIDGKTMTLDSTVTLDRTKWDIRYGSGKFFQNLADNVIDDNFTVAFKIVAESK